MFQNYVLPENTNENFFPKSDLDKVQTNLEVIKLVKSLESNHQQATPEQQAKLARYVGWGGLANKVFDEYNNTYKTERLELKKLLTKKEYQSAKASSLTAYYTDPKIARAMWQQAIKEGVTKGNILDPALGTGMFFMTMPRQLQGKVTLYGIEKDTITGLIAKQLFPNAHILIKGFEDVKFKHPEFDLVITNVPFGATRILSESGNKTYYIHDYFLKKSLNCVRDFGLVAIISSIGLMDKRINNIIQEIKDKADFLGGVRLPSSAFQRIAGTDVTSDILFFQKDEQQAIKYYGQDLTAVKYQFDDRVYINNYFETNPSQVLGKIKIANYHGATLKVINHKELLPQLQEALTNISYNDKLKNNWGGKVEMQSNTTDATDQNQDSPLDEYSTSDYNVYYRTTLSNGQTATLKNKQVKPYICYTDKNNNVIKTKNSATIQHEFDKATAGTQKNIFDTYTNPTPVRTGRYKGLYKRTIFFVTPYTDKERAKIIGFVKIKNDYQKLIDLQLQNKMEFFPQQLEKLNQDYDEFVLKYGWLNASSNTKLFRDDNRYSLVASLEDQQISTQTGKRIYRKSDAFRIPCVRPTTRIANVSSAKDALLTSISDGRGVDFGFMETIYPNHSQEQIKQELTDEIFIDPETYLETGSIKYVAKSEFLSGDILTKLSAVSQLIAMENSVANWKHYKDLLEDVKPATIAISDISFRLASAWIPNKVITNFLLDTFNESSSVSQNLKKSGIIITSEVGRQIDRRAYYDLCWSFVAQKYCIKREGERLSKYSNALDIINYLLNARQPVIRKVDKKHSTENRKRYITDEALTLQLRDVEQQLEKLFQDYINKRPEEIATVEKAYNHKYNRMVTRKFDGSHLFIKGLARNYQLRDYQANAVERIIETKRALLAHEVGTGKTLTMISAGFKLKDLGLINRPMFVVPSSLVAQFGQDAYKFYPSRKMLITSPEDFKKSNRRRFLSKIITSDYDGIVIGQSQFSKIKMNSEYRRDYLENKASELEDAIFIAKDKTNQSLTVKRLEQRRNLCETQLKKLIKQQQKHQDNFMNFEELGIDFLFIDEAHNYKNVKPISFLGSIKGITQQTSQRAIDLQVKIKYLHEKHENANVVFATGTPVSNSISELWTMMNFVQPDVLEKYNIAIFDNWVGAFGLIKTVLELNTTGNKYQAVKRFEKFVNLPELMNIYRITADIQMADKLNLQRPKVKRYVIASELTPAQKDKLDQLVKRTQRIKSGDVDPSEDNMLKITGEARKLTLDLRLLNENYSSQDSKKLTQVVDNVYRLYKRTNNHKGTQIIFSDLGTPSKKEQFDIYNELKEMLEKRGIPQDEIAFMHSAKTAIAKVELERKVNAGKIRILIGSTQKGGTGLNVQKRIKAIHHLDVPWRPADIIQRNGRGVRQGNTYREVEIYHYITKGSFDNYLWQIQENKLKYITQVMTAKSAIRAMKDVDSETLTVADFKALATKNPYLKLKMKVDSQLKQLQNQKNAFDRNYSKSIQIAEKAKESAKALAQELANRQKDLARMNEINSIDNKDFVFTTEPRTYQESSDINKRLKKEFLLIVRNPSVNAESATIATVNGFEIKADYNSTRPQLNSYSSDFSTVADLYICGHAKYNLQVNLEFINRANLLTRIKNKLTSLPDLCSKTKAALKDKQFIANQSLTDNVFNKQSKIDFLSHEQKLLNHMISKQSSVAEIKTAVNKFVSAYHAQHPDVVIDDQQVKTQEKKRYAFDPSVYDDSLFETETKSETQSLRTSRKPITLVTNKQRRKHTVKKTKQTALALFSNIAKPKRKPAQSLRCQQLSLSI